MIIPKEQLNGEDVRQAVEQTVRDYLRLELNGYKCDSSRVVNVLVKAAIEGQTIESVCEDLVLEVGSNTIHEHLNALLDVYDLRRQECEMNAALAGNIPESLPRRGQERALELHDEPFYGTTPELRTYACRSKAKEGTTYTSHVNSKIGAHFKRLNIDSKVTGQETAQDKGGEFGNEPRTETVHGFSQQVFQMTTGVLHLVKGGLNTLTDALEQVVKGWEVLTDLVNALGSPQPIGGRWLASPDR